jgi:CheY-like chemotaxis protein
VIDDEPIIASTLALILNSSGFSATAFTDPLGALVAVETQCPDFLISDVVMLQLNGIDLEVQFKAYTSCLQDSAIFWTGSDRRLYGICSAERPRFQTANETGAP